MPNLPDVTPTWVIPMEESYNVIKTQSETLIKTFDLMSVTPIVKFRLQWRGVTDGDFAAILQHYRDVSGTFAAFTWDCVPTYIDGGDGLGVSMTGRWAGKPSFKPKARSWDLEMVFEKDIS